MAVWLYGRACGERSEADVADGCTWWDGRVSTGARRLGTARFFLSLCGAPAFPKKRGFLCERSLERCAYGQGGVSSGFRAGAALRPPSFEERRSFFVRMERRAGFAAGLSDGGGRAFGRAEANRRQSAGLRI